MELVDVYNERYENTGKSKERGKTKETEYRKACFVWIINSENKILVQQRSKTRKHYPNLWAATSGGGLSGETSIQSMLRELKEELGLNIKEKELTFIGTYKRVNDFVDTYLLEKDIDVNDVTIQPEEVQNVKWMSIYHFEKLIARGEASDTSFGLFKNYYDNYYKRTVEFIDGKPVLRKIKE